MQGAGRIVVFQTAFIGDVILTTPLIQLLHRHLTDVLIDVVAIPAGASILRGHPDVNEIIEYDKRGRDKGIVGIFSLVRLLKKHKYDAAIIPHRSLRSGLICFLAGIPRRIGFSTSAAQWLMTDVVPYRPDWHETARNASLLRAMRIPAPGRELPCVFPSTADVEVVRTFLSVNGGEPDNLVAIAPGSVWATKRWPTERFALLASKLIADGQRVVLVGGKDDVELAQEIERRAGKEHLVNAVGELSLLQSAELIRRSRVLIANDSAPMHLAVAVRTPVVAIFGATIPEFGFAPLGDHDIVVQRLDLKCRPCAIHGGPSCPIGTFECMMNIEVNEVLSHVNAVLAKTRVPA